MGYFTPYYSVFVVNFEHVIADWECTEINYEMIPEMSDIPDKYGNLALMCSLSAL